MSTQFDITRHIDYENHMRDYIKKSEAKRIIENIKNQVGYRPIQSHPDYPALMNMLKDQHRKDMSKLEQEMKRKTQAPGSISEITQHPDYKTVMQKYENEIRRLNRQVSLLSAGERSLPSTPLPPSIPPPLTPSYPLGDRSPSTTSTPSYLLGERSPSTTSIPSYNTVSEPYPVAANNYPPSEVPTAPSWKDMFGGFPFKRLSTLPFERRG